MSEAPITGAGDGPDVAGSSRRGELPHEQAADSDEIAALDAVAAGASCPLCQGLRLHYAFSIGDRRVVRCAECRLVLLNPRAPGTSTGSVEGACLETVEREQIEGPAPLSFAPPDPAGARAQLQQLARYRGQEKGAMLVVDAGQSGLPGEASALGFEVTLARLRPGWAPGASPARPVPRSGAATEVACADLALAGLTPGSFDVCALTGALEAARQPLGLLRAARRLLKPDGVLLVSTPSLDFLCARLAHGGPEAAGLTGRLAIFDFDTIQTALHQAGFDQAIVQSPRRFDARLASAGMTGRALELLRRAVRDVRSMPRSDATPDGVLAMARAAAVRACRTLSVVVPAYNEAATVGPLLDALLRKRVAGVRIEVIVVESNSTDGTRDIVRKFAMHPRVRIVLEERPRGKGHAVRTGLSHATGDYVLIQDADLEYDLEDYDVLLEPLAAGREALVLGSRHGGNAWWKMRQFAGQPLASLALNCGHWFFTTLLNVLFGQRLKDPFTMYKVFRRDCIFGLDFKCNRFDFDYELLVKMIRKGYHPIEIPVNYRSRSFKEGKKVSAFRDPFNWLKALAWLRVVQVDPLAEIERRRLVAHGKSTIGEAAPTVPVQGRADRAAA